jgi:hypothetical protein
MKLQLKCGGFNYVADVDGAYPSANSLSAMISDTRIEIAATSSSP